MNCYNGEAFLKESIQSVLDQTYPNWELVIWDNQSTDISADIIKSFRDSRIHYHLAPQHNHLGKSRQLAQKHLTGDWIGILDCDDIWFPNKLERQMTLIQGLDERDHCGMVYSQALLLINRNNEWVTSDLTKHTPNPPPQGNIFSTLARNNIIPLLTVLINKQVFSRTGGFSGKYKISEDYSLNLRIAKVSKIAAVAEPLAAYRLHDSAVSATSQRWVSDFEDIKVKLEHWRHPSAVIGTIASMTRLIRKLINFE